MADPLTFSQLFRLKWDKLSLKLEKQIPFAKLKLRSAEAILGENSLSEVSISTAHVPTPKQKLEYGTKLKLTKNIGDFLLGYHFSTANKSRLKLKLIRVCLSGRSGKRAHFEFYPAVCVQSRFQAAID